MLILENCTLFDGLAENLIENASVLVEGEHIREVRSGEILSPGSERIDLGGRFLMPGLIDLHFHAYSPTFNMRELDTMPKPLLVSYASQFLRQALQRGFTTIRDPGGGDNGLYLAVERALIDGPRFFFGGRALSQTGGHGDMRNPNEVEPCGCGYSGVLCQIVDGPDAVRKAAREELRRGAHHVKVFISGGVASPSDPLWMSQFTNEELRAAVEEAARWRRYVAAHCHTDEGALRCVEAGIRSIEHGTQISASTAARIAQADECYVVPTLAVIHQLVDHGEATGMKAESIAKVSGLMDDMRASIENCRRAGVEIGFGTDLFGADFHPMQSNEFRYRAEVERSIDILFSATSVSAKIMQQAGRIGQISEGALADMVVLNGNPLEDISIFERWQADMPMVMKGGAFVRNDLQTAP